MADSSWDLAPTPDWTKVTLDITSEATKPSDGTFEVGFEHRAGPTTAGSFDVDDVSVYSCATPISGVRGDWTGQGTVDLLSTRSDGTLWVYEGKGDGTLRSGAKVGSGWAAFTWQGSPGHVNGDKRGDIVAVNRDGTLFSYLASSTRLTSAKQVGSGWKAMTWLTSPGDMNKDGRGDLIARRSDGTLWFYAGRSGGGGGLVSGRQVGSGWNSMVRIL